jgi:hypothetical protein
LVAVDLPNGRTLGYSYGAVGSVANQDLSETYAYDEVYRLIGTDRGQFVDGVFTDATDYQDWTLDGAGNMASGTTQARNSGDSIHNP